MGKTFVDKRHWASGHSLEIVFPCNATETINCDH